MVGEKGFKRTDGVEGMLGLQGYQKQQMGMRKRQID